MASKAGLNGLGIAYMVIGGIALWSGITGKGFGAILKSTISGQTTPTGKGTSVLGDLNQSVLAYTGSSSSPSTSTLPSGTAGENQAIAKVLAAPYGWSTGENWTDLVDLWNRESGWSNTAKNPDSGAYGIAQALPPTKYPAAGQESGGSSASAQISWGLSYIKSTYGNPVGAWAHENSAGWY